MKSEEKGGRTFCFTNLGTMMRGGVQGLCACALLAVLATAGCAEEFRGKPPLREGFHYPIALTLDAQTGLLYVVNTNFDLAYQHASIVSLDPQTGKFAAPFLALGSFPGDIVLVDRSDGRRFGYVAVRGDNSLTWFEIRGGKKKPTFVCNPGGEGNPLCSGRYVVKEGELSVDDGKGPQEVDVGPDPFGLAFLPGSENEPDRLILSDLADGKVTAFDIDSGGEPLFAGQLRLSSGLHSLGVDPVTRLVYVTNRSYPVVYRLRVSGPPGEANIKIVDTVSLPSPYATAQFSRGLAFAGSGTRVLIAYRTPSGLVVLDGADENTVMPQEVIGFVPLGSKPGQVRVFPSGKGGKELAYVVCYGDDTVWVVDPFALLPVDRIEVGAGPYDMTAVVGAGPARGYVSNFLGDSVSVIDLDPESPNYHKRIAEFR